MGNQALALRPEVIDDLVENTNFTAEEIRMYYRNFLHNTPHGKMTMAQDEFKAVYSEMFPGGDATKFAEHVFLTFDKDGDGSIDFREFLTSVSVQQKGTFQEKLNWAFNLYDIDNSGSISKSELEQMIKSFRQLNAKSATPKLQTIKAEDLAAYIIDKADTNNDKELSKQEFMEAARTSKTLEAMIRESLDASGSPFTKRKQMKPRSRSNTAEASK